MRASLLLLPLLAVACANVEGKLDDVTYGRAFDADFDETVQRARMVLLREFPTGLDPDVSNEEAGDLWTIWNYRVSVWYRGTTRWRAHVKVEHAGPGKVRLGVSVVKQLNDNIDNPHDINEARWVRTQRDPETSKRLEDAIARRYLDVKPSEHFEEKYSGDEAALNKALINRSADVDLSDPKNSADNPKLKKD